MNFHKSKIFILISVYFEGFPYLISKYAKDFGLVDEECFPYEGKEVQCKERGALGSLGLGTTISVGFMEDVMRS